MVSSLYKGQVIVIYWHYLGSTQRTHIYVISYKISITYSWSNHLPFAARKLKYSQLLHWNVFFPLFTFTFTYPLVMDCRDVTGVLATNSLHSSRLSAFLKVSLRCNPVHSFILSSHLFFCLPLFLPPGTVPCSMVFCQPWWSGHVPVPLQLPVSDCC